MNFLPLDGLHCFGGWVDLVLNGELSKGKVVCHDGVLCWFQMKNMVCERTRCDVALIVVVKMVQTHSLGEKENGFLQSQVLCRRNTREETCVDRKQETRDSKRKGIPKLAPISQVPWIHHIFPRRNMLALFRSLKKLDASAAVIPVTSWFLSG